MKYWWLLLPLLALPLLGAGDPYGAAAWRQLKFLLTDLSCNAQGDCDLAAGTTIGGAAIGGGGTATSGDSATAFFPSGTFEDALITGSAESDEITGLTDGQISDTLTASASTTAAANTNTTAIATTAFVQQEIDDVDLLSDNCILENDSTPIPDSCVGDGTDGGGGGGGISYADAAAGALAGF